MKRRLHANATLQTAKRLTALIALGTAALVLTSTAFAKEQQTRPFFRTGHVVVVIDFTDFTWTSVVEGNATHLGKFTGGAEGYIDPETETGPIGFAIDTAANGDQLFGTFTIPAGVDGLLTYTGGTGRFEDATGSGVQRQFNVVETRDGPILTLTYDDEVIGTITYSPGRFSKVEQSSEFYTWYSVPDFQAVGRVFSDLATIDRTTGKATARTAIDYSTLGGVGMPISLGLSFDPRDGTMYAIVNWVFGPAPVSELVKIDPETGAVTRIGETNDIHFGGSETDNCGHLYAVGFTGGYPEGSGGPPSVYVGDTKLYRFDIATGAKTEVGDTGISNIMDLAFDKDGKLWATANNKLFTLDLQTGASTEVLQITGVPTEGQPRNAVMSIDFATDGTLYGSSTEGYVAEFAESAFFTIDMESGAITMVSTGNGLGAVHGGDFKTTGAKCTE